ncbi:hypothetical protein Tsubulata_007866, partial [Turnera subulata]
SFLPSSFSFRLHCHRHLKPPDRRLGSSSPADGVATPLPPISSSLQTVAGPPSPMQRVTAAADLVPCSCTRRLPQADLLSSLSSSHPGQEAEIPAPLQMVPTSPPDFFSARRHVSCGGLL